MSPASALPGEPPQSQLLWSQTLDFSENVAHIPSLSINSKDASLPNNTGQWTAAPGDTAGDLLPRAVSPLAAADADTQRVGPFRPCGHHFLLSQGLALSHVVWSNEVRGLPSRAWAPVAMREQQDLHRTAVMASTWDGCVHRFMSHVMS